MFTLSLVLVHVPVYYILLPVSAHVPVYHYQHHLHWCQLLYQSITISNILHEAKPSAFWCLVVSWLFTTISSFVFMYSDGYSKQPRQFPSGYPVKYIATCREDRRYIYTECFRYTIFGCSALVQIMHYWRVCVLMSSKVTFQ